MRSRSLIFAATAWLAGCAPQEPTIFGLITVAPSDASEYERLEIRIVDEAVATGNAKRPWPHGLPAYSRPVAEIDFPHEYAISDDGVSAHGVIAWLTDDPDSVWPRDDEPSGTATYVLCHCITHVPAFAEDVDIALE